MSVRKKRWFLFKRSYCNKNNTVNSGQDWEMSTRSKEITIIITIWDPCCFFSYAKLIPYYSCLSFRPRLHPFTRERSTFESESRSKSIRIRLVPCKRKQFRIRSRVNAMIKMDRIQNYPDSFGSDLYPLPCKRGLNINGTLLIRRCHCMMKLISS